MKGQNQGLLFWIFLSLHFAYAHHLSYSKFFPVAPCFSEELISRPPPDPKVSDGKSNHPYCGEVVASR